MTTLSIPFVYDSLRAARFTPANAEMMTAIGIAESRLNDAAIGDVGLEDSFWGPSVGLFQERTIKGETGHNTMRDIRWLLASPAHQCVAAYETSGGDNFHPWSTWLHGSAQAELGRVRAALVGHTVTQPSPIITLGGSDMLLPKAGQFIKPQTIRTGIWSTLTVADPFTVLSGPALVTFGQLYLEISNLLPEATILVRPYLAKAPSKKGAVATFVESWGIDEQNGSTGTTFKKFEFTGEVPAGQWLRFQATVSGQAAVTIEDAKWHLNYQK